MNEILSDAKKIIHNAIQTSLPDEAVKKFIGGKTFAFEGRVIVIAIGKAAWNMAKAAAENIPHRIDACIVLTKYDHAKGEIPGFTILEAGHPLPDENTILGTQKIMDAVSGLTEKDTVFFLVSGGGSALFECPAGELTLAGLHTGLNLLAKLKDPPPDADRCGCSNGPSAWYGNRRQYEETVHTCDHAERTWG